ncbi:class I SAM-dependent methyltransferase [Flexivirga caeni]|uniref:Class I SAM-dependent methyltransferase n=1 Tax=Flexivirga caeni TaxID=2294115 RepID=A0A3M9M2R3_9MICO|nr:class I SAM-dependent methyltransferase [Flexivirga caeni]RNI19854.1 class I SAM-dependent methyltransferase [Flexivirga caeni]
MASNGATRPSHQHDDDANYFEASAWQERYAGADSIWSGDPNPQLVAEASKLTPGTALDVGCGEGGDVIWLAQHGWHATGADFSSNGLARAAQHAAAAGVADRTDWWHVDAREFDARTRDGSAGTATVFDLVTTHFLHLPDGGMVDGVRRLAGAVAPGGHLLVVGHSPDGHFTELSGERRRAMFLAAELVPGLPDGFEALVVEQRPRTVVRDGQRYDIADSTLLARRVTAH